MERFNLVMNLPINQVKDTFPFHLFFVILHLNKKTDHKVLG